MRSARYTLLILLTLVAAACSGGGESGSSTPPPAAKTDVPPTGNIITVLLITDEKGNYYSPATIEASRGDVIRFTLKTGVHNVNFLPDSNSIREGLPPVSDFLQIPGQEYDLPVTMRPGSYYFQCDPHVALGMKGQLIVK